MNKDSPRQKKEHRFSCWRTMCFEQALCAKFMYSVRKRKSTLYLGVHRDPDTREFQAHAWLICNREIVKGGGEAPHCKVHSRFYG
ncbi:MAG: lasso peptide biosynthesis B2 protein [Spirosomataceae bacterium]